MRTPIFKWLISSTLPLLLFVVGSAHAAETYDDYMKRIQDDMKQAGIEVDVFSQNPFQTGTALSGYYLNEKTLLLERDAFMQMKANKLETTDEVADFQHRVKVLRAHGNNILLQLIQALQTRGKDGFIDIEKPKQDQDIDKIIEDCKKDSNCVVERLQNPETSLKNIFLDNFAMATQVFKQTPQMQVIEINSIYQLVQLIYLEVFRSEGRLSAVEYGIFYKKQKELFQQIKDNKSLTPAERSLHSEMVKNTINQWKKRILDRKYEHADEFKKLALDVNQSNREIYAKLVQLRKDNAALFKGVYDDDKTCWWGSDRTICNDRKNLSRRLGSIPAGAYEFLGQAEQELPAEFWENL